MIGRWDSSAPPRHCWPASQKRGQLYTDYSLHTLHSTLSLYTVTVHCHCTLSLQTNTLHFTVTVCIVQCQLYKQITCLPLILKLDSCKDEDSMGLKASVWIRSELFPICAPFYRGCRFNSPCTFKVKLCKLPHFLTIFLSCLRLGFALFLNWFLYAGYLPLSAIQTMCLTYQCYSQNS